MFQRNYDEDFQNAKVPVKHKNELIDTFDMIDSRYHSEELPDDFMYERIGLVFKEDPFNKVFTEKFEWNGIEMSKTVQFDPDNNKIHMAPKRIVWPRYMPEEDFAATDLMYDWFDDYRAGIRRDLPDLPKPMPIIPVNQYYKVEQNFFLERYVFSKGMIVADPSFSCRENCPDILYVKLDNEKQNLKKVADFIDDQLEEKETKEKMDKLLFFKPYADIDKDNPIYEKIKYVSMQFNPFHPMAVRIVRSFTWEDSVIKGEYEYRGKMIPFEYDINDQRFRVHSHIWLQIARGYRFDGSLEVFDMVGNFPFNDILKFKDKNVYVEPLIIEPLMYIGRYNDKKELEYKLSIVESYPYSIIGQGNYFQRGVGKVIYCPYANITMKDRSKNTIWAFDITKKTKMNKREQCLKIAKKNYYFKKNELQSDKYFFKKYDNDDYLVYEIMREVKRTKEKVSFQTDDKKFEVSLDKEGRFIMDKEFGEPAFKFYFSNIKFYSFPRNVRGSLITDFRTIKLQDAILMDSGTLHEYWPFLVPYEDTMDGDEIYDYSRDTITISVQGLDYGDE